MNTKKLNKYLEPYDLKYDTSKGLKDTLRVLQKYGFNIQFSGVYDNQGFWLENRPLNDEQVRKIVFAITTNPHITKEQANEILGSLTPIVTEFNEPLLVSTVDNSPKFTMNEFLFKVYFTIIDAIANKRRIMYTTEAVRYNEETKELFTEDQWEVLFTPSKIYQSENKLYMFGYNHNNKSIKAIPLDEIKDIRPSFKKQDPNREKTYEKLKTANPAEYIPNEMPNIIYSGPIVFRCRGQYLSELLKRFGPTDKPIEKDSRFRADYSVKDAVITTDTLHWLASIPGYSIRIKSPDKVKKAISEYYEMNIDELFNPSLYVKSKHKEIKNTRKNQ